LLLALLALVFFLPLVSHPMQVLYSGRSDLLAMHLPMKRFLVRSWQETGELPLWFPYSFAGMPFVHDVQVAMFYPPHGLLLLLTEEQVGPVLSWLVVFHVIVAGWSMYFYAGGHGLGAPARLVAAVGFMFAGKWLLHLLAAGHTIMAPLAWLPLVLAFLERAIRQGSAFYGTAAGAAFALIVLGAHPQLTFYAGLFCGLWSLAAVREAPPGQRRRALVRWLLAGTGTALVAVALSAVQLLPALEATPETTRATGVTTTEVLRAALPTLVRPVGPALGEPRWELQGSFGLLWVAVAGLAPFLRPRARFPALVTLVLLAFAFGGAALVQGLPGFRLFQLPSRMLLLAAFAVAFLAGCTTQALVELPAEAAAVRRRLLRIAAVILAVCGGLLAWQAYQVRAVGDSLRPHVYWLALPLLILTAARLLSTSAQADCWRWASGWLVMLTADAWLPVAPYVEVRPESEIYAVPSPVRDLAERRAADEPQRWRVLDRGQPNYPSTGPLGVSLPPLGPVALEPALGYNTFDVRRYREYLQLIAGLDEPVRPRQSFVGYPIVEPFLIEDKPLLDLLGVRYAFVPADPQKRPLLPRGHTGPGEPGTHPGWKALGPAAVDEPVYSFLAGGRVDPGPQLLYENTEAFPRAFVVPRAAPLPERGALGALRAADLRSSVFLEGPPALPGGEGTFRPARVVEYRPNRVVVELDDGPGGVLVLTDIMYPGWRCAVDGEPAPLSRANTLFRATPVSAGPHTVVFTFEPTSYQRGRRVSGGALAGLFLAVLAAGWRAVRRARS
jgi:hypothetical protein